MIIECLCDHRVTERQLSAEIWNCSSRLQATVAARAVTDVAVDGGERTNHRAAMKAQPIIA